MILGGMGILEATCVVSMFILKLLDQLRYVKFNCALCNVYKLIYEK